MGAGLVACDFDLGGDRAGVSVMGDCLRVSSGGEGRFAQAVQHRAFVVPGVGTAVVLLVVAGCAASSPPSGGESQRPRFVTTLGPNSAAPIPDYRQAHDVAATAATVWFDSDLSIAAWRDSLSSAATDEYARKIRGAGVSRPSSGSLLHPATGGVSPRRSSPERIEFIAQTTTAPLLVVTDRVNGAWRLAEIRNAA